MLHLPNSGISKSSNRHASLDILFRWLWCRENIKLTVVTMIWHLFFARNTLTFVKIPTSIYIYLNHSNATALVRLPCVTNRGKISIGIDRESSAGGAQFVVPLTETRPARCLSTHYVELKIAGAIAMTIWSQENTCDAHAWLHCLSCLVPSPSRPVSCLLADRWMMMYCITTVVSTIFVR